MIYSLPLAVSMISLTSVGEMQSAYQSQLQAHHPDYISFVTGQSEKFFAFEAIAQAVHRRAHPEGEEIRRNTMLRYPDPEAPKDVSELFLRYPLREDYDTVSDTVATHLVAASPSLSEDEGDESAMGIFLSNDRDQNINDFVYTIFKMEHVSKQLFRDKVDRLLEEAPSTGKGGLITHFFLPNDDRLKRALYLSMPYGIPCEEAISDFYKRYDSSQNSDSSLQLRFLPSSVAEGAVYRASEIETVRYTFLTGQQQNDYHHKVYQVISSIFQGKEVFDAAVEENVRKLEASSVDDKTLIADELIDAYLESYQPNEATKILRAFDRFPKVEQVVLCLIATNKLSEAEALFEDYRDHLFLKNQILAWIALCHIDQGVVEQVDHMLSKMDVSAEKNLVLLMAASAFPDHQQSYIVRISPDFSCDLEELFSCLNLTLPE